MSAEDSVQRSVHIPFCFTNSEHFPGIGMARYKGTFFRQGKRAMIRFQLGYDLLFFCSIQIVSPGLIMIKSQHCQWLPVLNWPICPKSLLASHRVYQGYCLVPFVFACFINMASIEAFSFNPSKAVPWSGQKGHNLTGESPVIPMPSSGM